MALRINRDTHFVDATMVDGTCDCVLFQGTVIEAGAWRDESNLKEIEIGDGVTEITTGAFENCTVLTKVILLRPPAQQCLRARNLHPKRQETC